MTPAGALIAVSLIAAALPGLALAEVPTAPKPRLIVISDIGNEPDDQMSLVRLLLYANDIDIEALIASTSTWQKTKTSPEIIHSVIAAYGKVQPSLLRHATGWPTAAALDARVASGQPGYGLAAIGADKLSPGAQAIIAAADRNDARPLWVALWGGANTLAQALVSVRDSRDAAGLAAFVAKLRIYAISDQDDAGPWIRSQFPELFFVVQPSLPDGGNYASASWTGISGDAYYRNGEGADASLVTNAWLDRNIRSKGPLGAHYPRFLFIMEGDTPSFLGLIPNGLNAPETPDWGGWGGRYLRRQPYGEARPIWTQGGDLFSRVTSADTVAGHTSDQATIWRWRAAYQNDFAARMDWTIRDFAHANHPPLVVVNRDSSAAPLQISVRVGGKVKLDASGTNDPDGNRLSYRWLHYAEAGAASGNLGFAASGNLADISIAAPDADRATVTARATCRKPWLDTGACDGDGVAHIVLAVTDSGTPALTRYRRIILTVKPAE